jgi:hypothetical protein
MAFQGESKNGSGVVETRAEPTHALLHKLRPMESGSSGGGRRGVNMSH